MNENLRDQYTAETGKKACPDKYEPEWISPAYTIWLEKKYTKAVGKPKGEPKLIVKWCDNA